VIICEAVDGVYPHFSSSSSEMQQEEKRVLYVALSRAKKRLFITTHDTFITSYGNQKHREPSPFLKDILPFFNQTSHIPGQ
jgi:DNA helicase-2/ATP-dependent DNA helicase PcrA